MKILIELFVVISVIAGRLSFVLDRENETEPNPEIVSRAEWGARPPKGVESMPNPVSHVVIHHSYIPPACTSPQDCVEKVKFIQDMHMDDNGWNDIGYSFLVGSDGRAYVGRGWDHVGAHAPGYNNRSIGICIIGDWQEKLPPKNALQTVHDLIAFGVEKGNIHEEYTLLGHRQTRPTECPGQALYDEITTWPHFSPCPPPVEPGQASRNKGKQCPTVKSSKAEKTSASSALRPSFWIGIVTFLAGKLLWTHLPTSHLFLSHSSTAFNS